MSLLSFNSLVCWQITLTLVHVSWIGLVIGLSVALANAVLRNSTANRRYWLNFASLLLFAASLPVTLAVVHGVTAEVPTALNVVETPVADLANLTPPAVEALASSMPPTDAVDFSPNPPQSLTPAPEVPAVVSSPPVTQTPPSAWERVISIGHAAAPFVAILYAIGVALMFVKLAYGVRVSRKLRSTSQPVTDATILARLAEQAKKLSLRITPVVAYCEHTAVPIVVGLLRPMILIPAAMVSGLTIEQLESVLTHELAHLRRRDHLMIVVQRVLEAILFFHPVTWYLSHRLHDDRETSCDDLVLSIGGDRLQYAQSLLRVAELRLAGQSHQKHIALAADGQRPSKLRLRIARLLGDTEGDSVRVSSVWLLTILVGTFIVGIWTLTATSQPVAASIADEARIQTEESRKLIYQALASVRSIKTAHVKFRIARPGIEFNKTLDPKYVRQMIEDNDLVQNPDNLRRVLESFVSDASQIAEQPWSNVDLYREGKRVRTTTSSANHGPDEFVEDEVLSLRWDAANWQMNITPIAKERYYQETLDQFLLPDDDLLNGSNGSISMFRYLERFRGEGSARSMTTDPQTGNVSGITIFHPADEVKTEYLRLGWKKYDDQIWFPTVVAELNYENGNLSRCQLIIIEQAVFNKPLPAGIFQLGAPAGSVILEKTNDAAWARKINRDVFDVTSVEQVQAALEPLSKELTHDEENGVTEATRLYTLNEGTALKRIGPPFLLARKYLSRMLGDRQAHRPRELSRLISWNGTKFESYHSVDGGTFSAGHLARLLTGVGSPEIEGDKDLLDLSIPGDFVFREGATKEDLLRDLQEIVSNKVTTPVKIEFRNVERTVYRATGELKLNLPEGRSQVAINGGPHTGDFGESISGGNATSLLRSLAAYVKTRVINEVTAPDERFEWSERWYDLDSTKPENRFHLDAAVVLQQITEQTGIQFAEEKQVVPVLFIERANEKRPVADAPMNSDRPIKIIGHVHDIHGRPVSGANVSYPLFSNGIAERKPIRTLTDENGRFELSALSESLKFYPDLWIWHEGFSISNASVTRYEPGSVENLDVTLPPLSSVKIHVEDPEGRRVRNAKVYPAKVRMPNVTHPVDGIFGLCSFLPDEDLKEFVARTTDENGNVELVNLPVAVLNSVGVTSENYGTQEFDVERLSIPMTLPLVPVGEITGNAPAGTQVFIKSARHDHSVPVEGSADVVADADGKFEVKALLAGQVTITPRNSEHPEWLMEVQSAKLEPGSAITIDILPEATIPATGRLVHADSNLPIANVRVALQVGTSARTHLGDVLTDAGGKFTARCSPGEQFVVYVSELPEPTMVYPKQQFQFRVPVESESFVAPDIEIREAKIWKGKLVDANNNPVAGKYVQHYFNNKAIDNPSRTTDAGEFTFAIDKDITPDRWAAVLKWDLRDKSGNAGYANDKFEVKAKVISDDPLVLQVLMLGAHD